jgi:hypothetical protein
VITNGIITSFLQCQYKAYLQFNQRTGKKTTYEEVEDELLNACKTQFFEQLHNKLHPNQLLQDIVTI